VNVFNDHVLLVFESNTSIKKYVYAKYFKLQGHTSQLSILYKKNLIWKEPQAKTYDQLAFIKKNQKCRGQEEHNIKLLDKKKIENIEVDLSFWESLSGDNHRNIEDCWMQCLKIWDFLEDITMKCQLPSFGPL